MLYFNKLNILKKLCDKNSNNPVKLNEKLKYTNGDNFRQLLNNLRTLSDKKFT